ncbi:MAG TPA: hypothetical protein VFE60_27820 [Roseiarcus sp.]|jgi:hypothetical protein|nr:hypothetical protein [Roseiarcus sp.]
MPLADAFQHIQQIVGGAQLAEEDLRLRLESGEVEVQDRLVTPGEGIGIKPLSPEDFQNGLLFPRLPKRIGSLHREAHLRDNLLRRLDRYRSAGHNFFVRRSDIFRIWPIGGEAKNPRKVALPTTRPKGIGPKVWLATNKVWELWSEGNRSPNREALLRKVRVAIGDEGLSPRTLDEALAYLRQKRLIDR